MSPDVVVFERDSLLRQQALQTGRHTLLQRAMQPIVMCRH